MRQINAFDGNLQKLPVRTLSLLGIALAFLVYPARADNFDFTPIDVPGAIQTRATGINNSGEIVGWYWDSSGQTHGFVDVSGTFTTIDVPGSSGWTEVFGVNNKGDIVGDYQTSVSVPGATSYFYHGFIYDGTTYTTVDVPGAQATTLYGINDGGVATGNTGPFGASFTFDGALHYLSFAGSLFTESFGINNAGDVTGFYRDPGPGFHGFVEDGGVFQSFDVPGGFDTEPFAINNAGVIVGSTLGPPSGFLFDGSSTFTPLDYPGSATTIAYGVNDGGDLVGAFYDPSVVGLYRGFLATPVPEPGSLSLLVVGVVACAALRRRVSRSRVIRQQYWT